MCVRESLVLYDRVIARYHIGVNWYLYFYPFILLSSSADIWNSQLSLCNILFLCESRVNRMTIGKYIYITYRANIRTLKNHLVAYLDCVQTRTQYDLIDLYCVLLNTNYSTHTRAKRFFSTYVSPMSSSPPSFSFVRNFNVNCKISPNNLIYC